MTLIQIFVISPMPPVYCLAFSFSTTNCFALPDVSGLLHVPCNRINRKYFVGVKPSIPVIPTKADSGALFRPLDHWNILPRLIKSLEENHVYVWVSQQIPQKAASAKIQQKSQGSDNLTIWQSATPPQALQWSVRLEIIESFRNVLIASRTRNWLLVYWSHIKSISNHPPRITGPYPIGHIHPKFPVYLDMWV